MLTVACIWRQPAPDPAVALVNGERVEGTVVPPAPPGAVVRVEAVIEG